MKTFLISTLIFLPVLVGMESAKAGYGYNPYKSHYDSWNRKYRSSGGDYKNWNPYGSAYKRQEQSNKYWSRY